MILSLFSSRLCPSVHNNLSTAGVRKSRVNRGREKGVIGSGTHTFPLLDCVRGMGPVTRLLSSLTKKRHYQLPPEVLRKLGNG